eukprot:TRINITY_DN6915_c0_g1_i1.p2 TRINITY_DN6915_c0_g1~~TRINITY_DN6915_c0_g1_i1.p2  ORF type:complete len:185 (+),score=42.81 TRINITY_DN6915_c0_g1_i1:597-1151(+)
MKQWYQRRVRAHLQALCSYTYDLGMAASREDNLYFILNKDLRERAVNKIRLWAGYLHFLFGALALLPDFEGVVFRGVDQAMLQMVKHEYYLERPVGWSSFSSATINETIARSSFTGGQSGQGVLFKIKVLHGRQLSMFSPYPDEDEVLLCPNSKFLVKSSCENKAQNVWEVSLEEVNIPNIFSL